MSPEKRETFRLTLLSVLDANNTRWGFPASAVHIMVRSQRGIEASLEEVQPELAYLRDKGFVANVQKAVSPEIGTWRITAEGRDFLAERGL